MLTRLVCIFFSQSFMQWLPHSEYTLYCKKWNSTHTLPIFFRLWQINSPSICTWIGCLQQQFITIKLCSRTHPRTHLFYVSFPGKHRWVRNKSLLLRSMRCWQFRRNGMQHVNFTTQINVHTARHRATYNTHNTHSAVLALGLDNQKYKTMTSLCHVTDAYHYLKQSTLA